MVASPSRYDLQLHPPCIGVPVLSSQLIEAHTFSCNRTSEWQEGPPVRLSQQARSQVPGRA